MCQLWKSPELSCSTSLSVFLWAFGIFLLFRFLSSPASGRLAESYLSNGMLFMFLFTTVIVLQYTNKFDFSHLTTLLPLKYLPGQWELLNTPTDPYKWIKKTISTSFLDMTLNCIWCWGSGPGGLGNVK